MTLFEKKELILQHAKDANAATRPEALAVIRGLLDRWHAAGLRYCHWKSNEHVDAAVLGLTDLDILVDSGRSDDLHRTLAESGFRRFQATALTAYPAVEDYLAVDAATGRLVHLHLHHRLTLGQKHLKGYRLPWDEEVLSTRQFDPLHGIYVSAPETELLLLVVRDALKLRLRSRLTFWLGRSQENNDFQREFADLVGRCDHEAIISLGTRLIGPQVVPSLRRLLENGARTADRFAFDAVARPALNGHRTLGRLAAAILMPIREGFWVLGGLSRRHFHWALPLRRVSPRGGAIVVFLGSDGAGKSSLSADTAKWLGQKLDVLPVYFGSGDGPSSLVRMPLQFVRYLINSRVPRTGPRPPRSTWRGGLKGLAVITWALALSLEKRAKLRRMIRGRNHGLIVICDRFAQDQVEGFNDGPLLGQLAQSTSGLARALAEWEARPYRDSLRDPPDLVLKLIASPAVALARRPEMTAEEIERRIAVVRALQFPDRTQVIEVDADQPLDEVVRQVHGLVWKVL